MTHVAVDLLGGGSPPEGAFGALLAVMDAEPDLVLTVVAGPEQVGSVPASLGDRLVVRPAVRPVPPGSDAVRQVRAYRDSGVRVAARLVRDGAADAMVSCGPLEAVVASAYFTLSLVPGATQPSSAVVVDADAGPIVVCDAGAAPSASADQLVQHATTAPAFTSALYKLRRPKVGLLGGRGAVPDVGRRTADALLSSMLEASDVDYVGVVGARSVATGAGIDVLVTDGATGEIVTDLLDGLGRCCRPGVAVLGVAGGPVVATRLGSGLATTVPDLVAAVELAAASVRSGLPAAVRSGLEQLRANRRANAGLTS